jgi:hypothetical protein
VGSRTVEYDSKRKPSVFERLATERAAKKAEAVRAAKPQVENVVEDVRTAAPAPGTPTPTVHWVWQLLGVDQVGTEADLTDIADSLTFLVSIVVVVLILLASPGERRLVLGPSDTAGLTPLTDEERTYVSGVEEMCNSRVAMVTRGPAPEHVVEVEGSALVWTHGGACSWCRWYGSGRSTASAATGGARRPRAPRSWCRWRHA